MIKKNEAVFVPGYLANGIHAGIKTNKSRDLSLIYSVRPAKATGVFTTNCFKAPPVLLSMERLQHGMAQAIVTNSGNANAATGEKGYEDARIMAQDAARQLKIDEELVLVASTGVIGHNLPLEKIRSGMEKLVRGLTPQGIIHAEEAIMTTDKFPKIAYRQVSIGGKDITLCGIAKGAGMIQPNMATMLTYMLTDADFQAESLRKVFKYAADRTFNAISVDGCMSTNDTALILANGMAGNKPLRSGTKTYQQFCSALMEVMGSLATAIVRDGEGATKVIEIVVENAATVSEARKVAYAVANANLVKTAFFGGDPNWGRIISAAGSIGIPLPVDQVELYFEDVLLFSNGKGLTGEQKKLQQIMARDQIRLVLRIGRGEKSWRIYASDLTFDYVKINAHYHT